MVKAKMIRTLISKINENHKIVTVVLSLVIIVLGIANIWLNIQFNRQSPNLEVGRFPFGTAHVWEFTREDVIEINETVHRVNMSAVEEYVVSNFTFMIYNSGKGSAYGVNAKLVGEPADICKVISASVYVGEPIQSNFLRTVDNEYRIGLLGAVKAYTITFYVEYRWEIEETQRFTLTVTSENARTVFYHIYIQE